MTAAEANIGTRVRTLVEFASVPCLTQGVIDEEYSLKPGTSGVTVAWDLPDHPLPKGYQKHDGKPAIQTGILRDGFDKETELHYLEKV